MKRWMSNLPRYRKPIILQRKMDGPASAIGNQIVGTSHVRILKALNTSSEPDVTLPSGAAPSDNLTGPTGYNNDGWAAWWPDPPTSNTNSYVIPDPPRIPRTTLPTSENPVLWEAYAVKGTSVWHVRISAFRARCDWRPKTAKEKMVGPDVELSSTDVIVKVRAGIFKDVDVDSKYWEIYDPDDGSIWDINGIIPSYRRNEFMELMIQRQM